MDNSDRAVWNVAKDYLQRTSIYLFMCQVSLLLVVVALILYLVLSQVLFTQWVREQTQSVIRNPEIVGLAVEEVDGPYFSHNIDAIYSFETPQAMLAGIYQLCEKYQLLGWDLQSFETCKEKAIRKKDTYNMTPTIDSIISSGGFRFCITDKVRIDLYYLQPSVSERYPISVKVAVFARTIGLVCQSSFSDLYKQKQSDS